MIGGTDQKGEPRKSGIEEAVEPGKSGIEEAAEPGKTRQKARKWNMEKTEKTEERTRVAIIGVIVEEAASVEKLNQLLHDYGSYIVGRMGIPYHQKGINIISIAIDAPQDVISALSGKLGALKGVNSKAVYAKV